MNLLLVMILVVVWADEMIVYGRGQSVQTLTDLFPCVPPFLSLSLDDDDLMHL